MRFRQMATYRGVPYEAGIGPTDSDVVLFAACPPPEGLGFEPAPGHWRKRIIRAEADALWESRPMGSFHGEPCLVVDDLGDRLHIAYLGQDGQRARELGYWQVDRGVFELLTPRDEVTGLTEEKVEKGFLPAEAAATAPPMPSYPYSGEQYPPAPAAGLAPPAVPVRDAGPGYPGDPGVTPAGAWNGTGTAPRFGTGRGGNPPASNGRAGNGTPGSTGHSRNRNGAHREDPLTSKTWTGNGAPGSAGHSRNGNGAHRNDPLAGWNRNRSPYPPAGPGVPTAASPTSRGGTGPTAPPEATGAAGREQAGPGAAADAPTVPGGPRSYFGRRSARKQRVRTRTIFCELADLAAIPRSAYALEQEADGAMCLLRTEDGFEVFSAADGARHEVRTFENEEAAYFYLFGVLAAEAIRSGSLTPPR